MESTASSGVCPVAHGLLALFDRVQYCTDFLYNTGHSPVVEDGSSMNTTRTADEMNGERRIISILFCDVKGSTAAADQLDPEEWAEIINGAFEEMMQPIYRYEGTVVRLLGDAILAYFGAPIAREDDPQRAVLAALEIQQAVQRYSASVQRRWGMGFSVRCGINTGLVIVGNVGGSQHMEYSALGDAVNLAARMEQTAEPGAVQISEATYRLVSPFFEVEDIGELEVKGKETPQHTYRVVGRKTHPGTLRGLAGLQTSFIGHAAEFEALRSVLERLQRGEGNMAFLLGEAGVGKSRLIRELQSYSRNTYPDTHWYRTSSFSYEKTQPYGQVQRVLRSMCTIDGDEPPATQREKIAQTVARMTLPDPVQTQQVVETVLGVVGEPNAASRLEGEAFKGVLYNSMAAFGRALAEAHPFVVVFDDVQWIDSASSGLLEHVFGNIGVAPILIICAMRPSPDSFGWALMNYAARQFASHYVEVEVKPLADAESDELVRNLLASGNLPETLRQQILDKAAGNPLFIEEVVRVLIERSAAAAPATGAPGRAGLYGAALQVPDSLQTLLTARIDHVEQDVRRTMLLASVIGPTFNFRVLARIAKRDPQILMVHIRNLQQMAVIRETMHAPEVEYAFVHVLMQETAYRMILRRQRREYHARVGEALEELFPDRLQDNAVLLAHHFDGAEVPDRAARYYGLAGDAAFRLYSLQEAIAHFSRALELLQPQEGDQDGETLKHLYESKGRALELDTQVDAALATYDEMEALAQRRHDRALELAAMMARLPLYVVPTERVNPELGRSLGEKALALARDLNDQAAEARVLWILSNTYAMYSDMALATEYGEQSLTLAEQLNLREQLVLTLTDLAVFCYGNSGRFEKAKDMLHRASQNLSRTQQSAHVGQRSVVVVHGVLLHRGVCGCDCLLQRRAGDQ